MDKKICACGCGKEINSKCETTKYLMGHNDKSINRVSTKFDLICLNCGKVIKTHQCKKNTRKFCSNKCKYSYKPGRDLQAKKRTETFLRKYGSFKYVDVYGAERAQQLLDTFSEIRKEMHSKRSPEEKKRISEKVSKTLMGHTVSAETKEKMWKNRDKSSIGPNKFEIKIGKCFPKFKYIGNKDILINGRSADFVNEESRTVILANGWYWHLKRLGLEVNDENKRLREKIEAKPFIEAGYRVIFIWEDEFKEGIMQTYLSGSEFDKYTLTDPKCPKGCPNCGGCK